jgi:hypothetical protein
MSFALFRGEVFAVDRAPVALVTPALAALSPGNDVDYGRLDLLARLCLDLHGLRIELGKRVTVDLVQQIELDDILVDPLERLLEHGPLRDEFLLGVQHD